MSFRYSLLDENQHVSRLMVLYISCTFVATSGRGAAEPLCPHPCRTACLVIKNDNAAFAVSRHELNFCTAAELHNDKIFGAATRVSPTLFKPRLSVAINVFSHFPCNNSAAPIFGEPLGCCVKC